MEIDHLAVVCADLDEGSAWLEKQLGVSLQPGGQHPYFGTHNRLLGLGPGLYLEVIAPDPSVPDPGRPRWFGLDDAGAPKLGNWIARTDNLSGRPPGSGDILPLSRGDLTWEITVPADGSLCEGGAFPSLIRWGEGAHPSSRLADQGVGLLSLDITHPEPDRLAALLSDMADPRLRLSHGASAELGAVFDTPSGRVTLGKERFS
ncbi:VOC family protein [Flavimaricola marinus]|uniref:Glyoxalase-like domain-containing protein n=1 Tax=Flavimaricola marinus TaxID=1819565 RepID=A0A238LGH7_9RHOB|nr:VOC family protein [Flavimaricola marinus]SMY08524.1 hypothetical protein LOM8899_02677 [Flavimaricola marinus]